jgi:hypothetical protein
MHSKIARVATRTATPCALLLFSLLSSACTSTVREESGDSLEDSAADDGEPDPDEGVLRDPCEHGAVEIVLDGVPLEHAGVVSTWGPPGSRIELCFGASGCSAEITLSPAADEWQAPGTWRTQCLVTGLGVEQLACRLDSSITFDAFDERWLGTFDVQVESLSEAHTVSGSFDVCPGGT